MFQYGFAVCFLFSSVVLFAKPKEVITLTNYQKLQHCYNPGMLVTNLDSTKSKCSKQGLAVAQKAKSIDEVIEMVDIISSADSAQAAEPAVLIGLQKDKNKFCITPNMALVMLEYLSKGQKKLIEKCRPAKGPVLVNLFMHAQDIKLKNQLCEIFQQEIKQNNMISVCDLSKTGP